MENIIIFQKNLFETKQNKKHFVMCSNSGRWSL